MSVRIGPVRIADGAGTHEPGDEIDYPSKDLLALAESKAIEPESGLPYCEVVGAESPKPLAAKPTADATSSEKP